MRAYYKLLLIRQISLSIETLNLSPMNPKTLSLNPYFNYVFS